MRALVVDPGWSRGALAAVRSLGAAGWTVGLAVPDVTRGLALHSRHIHAVHRVPAPDADPGGFPDAVRAAVQAGAYELVLAAGDAEVLALSADRERIGAVVGYPEHALVSRLFDKLSLAELARESGVPTPSTRPADETALAAVRGPVMLKERLHARGAGHGGGRVEARLVAGEAAAREGAEAIRAVGGDPVLQDVVDGALLSLALVRTREGQVVGRVQQRAERVWPGPAGISVRARTTAVDPALATSVERLLERLGWWGLVQAQLLAPADGPAQLIDLNGRCYGSLALARASGVDLARLGAEAALGQPVAPAGDAPAGHRYQWLEGDLRRAAQARSIGELVGSLRYSRGAAHSIRDPGDPSPARHYAVALGRRALRKAARRGR